MADDRKIIIELSVAGGGSDDEGKENDEEKAAAEQSKKIKSVVKRIGSVALSELETQITYDLNRYVSLTDDYKTGLFIDNVKTTVSKVKNIAYSVVAYANFGSTIGGAWGAVVGATIGGVVSVTSTLLDVSRQYNAQSFNLWSADKEAKYARSRLGLIDNGRGTQN